ncbi:MAG: pantetheine-phosphate adenylyltransferase [Eubacteriales bacterium]|jgi:pantetheine-phosphate adenylyltransferase|nr:pantetheine-phosphate adenylyltransferase [Eubacteriales bacterium]
MKIAVYPGSFDPCTNGHLDIITRAARVFDKLIVAVLVNSHKTPAFTIEERMEFLRRVTRNISNIEIDSFTGLLADYTMQKNADVIIKGLRAVSDFEYEFQMALTNTKLNPSVETLFMTTSTANMYLSSSVVREVATYNGDLSGMVPDEIRDDIYKKIRRG